MKFSELSEEEQKRIACTVATQFKECHLESKSVPPLGNLFGKYNVIGYVEHPAFVSGTATVAMFDGITGKVKVYTGLAVLYGGLAFDQDLKEFDPETDTEELQTSLYWRRVVIGCLKEELITKEMRDKFK